MRHKRYTVVWIFLLFAIAGNAHAYTWLGCDSSGNVKRDGDGPRLWWGTNNPTISIDAGVTGAYLSAVQRAIKAANVNGSQISVTATTGDTSTGLNNGKSELFWGDDPTMESHTYHTIDCTTGQILEADIVLLNKTKENCGLGCAGVYYPSYTPYNWTDDLESYGGHYRSLESGVLNELGHFFGLGNTGDRFSLMGMPYGSVSTNGKLALGDNGRLTIRSAITPYFGQDASRGLVETYGASSALEKKDLSVSNFRYGGSGVFGEYALPLFGRMYSFATGALLPRAEKIYVQPGIDPYAYLQPHYVRPGEAIKAEFTYESNSSSTEWTTVSFYLSTDPQINTSDRKLASYIVALQSSEWPNTNIDFKIPIPTDVVVGRTYYVGVIIDSGNNVAEGMENNNISYLPIEIISYY